MLLLLLLLLLPTNSLSSGSPKAPKGSAAVLAAAPSPQTRAAGIPAGIPAGPELREGPGITRTLPGRGRRGFPPGNGTGPFQVTQSRTRCRPGPIWAELELKQGKQRNLHPWGGRRGRGANPRIRAAIRGGFSELPAPLRLAPAGIGTRLERMRN